MLCRTVGTSSNIWHADNTCVSTGRRTDEGEGRMARQAKKRRRSRATAITWVLLAIMVTAALSVGACALWLPDRAPSILGTAKQAQSAPASVQSYSGQQQVNVVPTISSDRELLGNASGIVTANWTDTQLRSGTRAYQVNDRTVIAIHTQTPLYRDLKTGDKGEDVRSLNNMLNALGYNSVPDSDTFNWNTANGWQQLMNDSGNTSKGELALTDTMWIPEDVVQVSGWTATQGSNVSAGTTLGKVPGGLVKLAIRGGQPSDKERTITVFGVSSPLPAKSTEITDSAVLNKIAQTQEYQSKTPEERVAGLDAQLSLNEAIQVLRVPAAAVFGVQGTSGCIAVDGQGTASVIPVEIISGELGASLVKPDSGEPEQVRTVLIGSRLNDLKCGA